MTSLISDVDTLKVTLDDAGRVWYLAGGSMPRRFADGWVEFLSSRFFSPDVAVRVTGSRKNAALVVALYGKKHRCEIASLEVCGPLCCTSPEGRRDPEVVLFSMRDYRAAASVGGWHEVGSDIASYVLASRLESSDVGVTEREILKTHPVWPALSFVQGIDPDAVARLIGIVVDPRWYADPEDPDRMSRLTQYLGLTPRTQADVAGGASSWRKDNCRAVLDCWKSWEPTAKSLKTLTPRQFLWRVRLARGGGVMGDLAASKIFVSFLRAVWSDAVCVGPKRGHLFVPEFFFAGEDEAKAFRDHAARYTAC